MKKFLSALCATALTAAVAVTGAVPAYAAPAFVPKAPAVEHSDVVNVQDYRWKRRQGDWQRNWQGGNWRERQNLRRDKLRRKHWRAGRQWDGPRYGWYNGHKGYPYKRHGYRYHNGFWFPAGAFIAGAIVGGAIANSNTYYRGGGSAHVQWCYDRYRSYREYDNSWQPYNGPRRLCHSPYS